MAAPDTTPPTFAILAGGGTAGHLLPGLAVGHALVGRGHDPASIHVVGSDRGVEAELVPPTGFGLTQLPGRGIQRRLSRESIRLNLAAIAGLLRALGQGIAIVRARRPAVVVGLGGHAAFACGVGAVLARVPLVLVEQNVRAGAVNRALRRFATASAVAFEGTDLPRATPTGNPLRAEIRAPAANPERAAARRALGLPVEGTVVGVFSGSLGSRRINEAVLGLVERWADRSELTVRHVIGRRDWAEWTVAPPMTLDGGLGYQAVEYEERMHLLLQAVDVVVTRSGGGGAELAALGVPAVLVPLPIATRDHQAANARVVAVGGGAVVVPDAELTAERLTAELEPLLFDGEGSPNRAELAAMGAPMSAANRPDAAERVAELVERHARG